MCISMCVLGVCFLCYIDCIAVYVSYSDYIAVYLSYVDYIAVYLSYVDYIAVCLSYFNYIAVYLSYVAVLLCIYVKNIDSTAWLYWNVMKALICLQSWYNCDQQVMYSLCCSRMLYTCNIIRTDQEIPRFKGYGRCMFRFCIQDTICKQ